MVKTRVHDLAAEFGIPSEQLLGMLRDMNIFVRSHMSALEGDQVAAVRVRWEREKRKADEPAPKKSRRRTAKVEEPQTAIEAKPTRRRRTAAEVAQHEAEVAAQQAEKEAERQTLELERPAPAAETPAPTAQSIAERARALFRDLPPLEESTDTTDEAAPAAPAAPESAAAPAEPAAP
ncbi:MAG: translation initiation factor IF-2 N-terminal domain-containing protein, partial [Gemmatimonadota bacterium]|nr:translation initiation factor IF-2 N-terminal domain-containing protein [Gemmatimonadota bacterium]